MTNKEMMEMMATMMTQMNTMMAMINAQGNQVQSDPQEPTVPEDHVAEDIPQGYWSTQAPQACNWHPVELKLGRKTYWWIDYSGAGFSARGRLSAKEVEKACSGLKGFEQIDVPIQYRDKKTGQMVDTSKKRWASTDKSAVEAVIQKLPRGFKPETLNREDYLYKQSKKAEREAKKKFHKHDVDFSDFI